MNEFRFGSYYGDLTKNSLNMLPFTMMMTVIYNPHIFNVLIKPTHYNLISIKKCNSTLTLAQNKKSNNGHTTKGLGKINRFNAFFY